MIIDEEQPINNLCYLLADNNSQEIEERRALCQQLGLEERELAQIPAESAFLKKTSEQWSIALNSKPSIELSIDYNSRHWQTHRLRQSYHKSPLRKALGRATAGSILDACAGLGRDCIILSALGYRVTACETNPVVFFLLQQAVLRSKFCHVELIQDNSLKLLERRNNWPIIYLDPMFTSNGKAQVKKPARILRALVANYDADNALLFDKARQSCRRLVVKRHIDAPALAGAVADIQYSGQSTRYDVYLQPDADNSSIF